jgi:hypothetical protein
VLIHLLKAIPDPGLSVTKADIDLQLREALISARVEMDLDIDTAPQEIQTVGCTNIKEDAFASQADYVSLLGLDNQHWFYSDADEDVDIDLY